MATFDPATLADFIFKHGHHTLFDLRYRSHGEDWVELTLGYDPKLAMEADSGILASGPIISLMDMATSMAVWCRRGAMSNQVTLDLRVDYLRPAVPGRTVHGRGECYRLTRRVAFVRGQAHDGVADDPIASVTGTFMLLDVQ